MDSKQAEKEYLRRSGGGQWEASKPFPPRGQVATEEHAQHILDFAVMLRVLAPRPSDVVLDLGAGSGWVSDWLRRCGFRTIALDIALDMLQLAAGRVDAPLGLITGDMEHLPFKTGVFHKACCLNAFHHVPNVAVALKEVRRVMSDEGVVFFSEPGVGHSTHPTSIAAARNYGVQENEIIISTFMDACLSSGFADVRLHPISHVMPLFELDRKQWASWSTYTASQRPSRALQKLTRSVLELFGWRKKDLLFEEAFAIRLLRELQPVIEQHAVITAHCRPFAKPSKMVDAAQITLNRHADKVRPGDDMKLRLQITNSGSTIWNESSPDQIRLGAQLLDDEMAMIDRNYARQELPRLAPGATCETVLNMRAPTTAGRYRIRVDLVREGSHWFEMKGCQPATLDIDVTA